MSTESLRTGRKMYLMHALCPNGPNSTTGFLVNPLGPDPGDVIDDAGDRALLHKLRTYSLRLVTEDAPIFDEIRFEAGCLTQSDRFLASGMSYIESFPTTSPGAVLICR